MPFLIDGNNLMHALPPAFNSRQAVRRMVLDLAHRERISLTLVFDGPPDRGVPEREALGPVTVIYSGSSTADDVLIRHIPGGGAARNWTLVTDDRELAARARKAGARTQPVSAWRRKLAATSPAGEKPDRVPSEAEIEEWQEFFRHGGES